MRLSYGVAIVAPALPVRKRLGQWFERAGYHVAVATTFSDARGLLSLRPDIVVSELKLGEYNGLHLAAHAEGLGIPSIVIGPTDICIERDAELLGATYLWSVRRDDLLALVEHQLEAHERWRSQGHCLPSLRGPMMTRPLPGRSPLAN